MDALEGGVTLAEGESVRDAVKDLYICSRRQGGRPSIPPRSFLRFSRLEAKANDIVQFVTRFGGLGDWCVERFRDRTTGALAFGEPLSLWRREIARMRHGIDLWEAQKKAPTLGDGPDRSGALAELVTRQLTGHTAVVLAPQRTSSPKLTIIPDGLLTALWLQFAEAITSAEQRRCESCGKPMKISGPGRRRTRRYCSDVCRTRGHRARWRITHVAEKPSS